MPRGWMWSLGLSLSVLTAALVASSVEPSAEESAQIEADPCFSYGRFECCVRP